MAIKDDDLKSTFTPSNEGEGDLKSTFTPIGAGDIRTLQLGIPRGPDTSGRTYNFDPALNATVDFTRPFIGNAASGLARTGAAMTGVGANPIVNTIAGTQGYALVDALMQQLKTDKPNTVGETFSEAEKEALINEAGQRIVGGVLRGASAIRNANIPEIYKLYPTSSQALEHFGYSKLLSTPAKVLEDVFAPSSKAAAQKVSGWASFQKALQLSNLMNGRTGQVNADPNQLLGFIKNTLESGINKQAAPGQFQKPVHYVSQELLDGLNNAKNPFEALDTALADKSTLQKYLSLGQTVGPSSMNVRGDLQAYKWNKILQDVTDVQGPGAARINTDKLNKIWSDPAQQDVLETLYGKGLKDNLSDFLKGVSQVQDDPMAARIKFNGKGFTLPSGLLTGLSVGKVLGPAVGAGLYLTNAAIGKLLTTQASAKILPAMVGKRALDVPMSYAQKAIFNALQGSSVAIIDNQGNKKWGTVKKQPDGSFGLEEAK